ncbi:hypothetical protein WN944_018738 [Citrus x changshan-huyou]|uniref:Uncharacterized protein n=1 Tax=Citrus x changshan-huyou TaxID=2935761 RepID=A0AAP0LVB3_9ROSI
MNTLAQCMFHNKKDCFDIFDELATMRLSVEAKLLALELILKEPHNISIFKSSRGERKPLMQRVAGAMTAKCTKQGEARQLVFDDSNACSAQARHPAFDDSDCEEDGVQRLGIWDCFSFQSLVSGGEQGRRE